jgi:hypothetical protein
LLGGVPPPSSWFAAAINLSSSMRPHKASCRRLQKSLHARRVQLRKNTPDLTESLIARKKAPVL